MFPHQQEEEYDAYYNPPTTTSYSSTQGSYSTAGSYSSLPQTPYPAHPQVSYSSSSSIIAPPQGAWNEASSIEAFTQQIFYEEPQPLYQPTQSSWQAPPTLHQSPLSTYSPPQQSYGYVQPIAPQLSPYAQPGPAQASRQARAQSLHSVDDSGTGGEEEEDRFSRGSSPGQTDLSAYGHLNEEGTWSCAYPGCTSRAVFTRGCDLRKHHKRHTKTFFCRYPSCSQSTDGGFSSKKDLARHEAKHNPGVVCEWEGCDRIFSRVDNMRDHVKRIHLRAARRGSGKWVASVVFDQGPEEGTCSKAWREAEVGAVGPNVQGKNASKQE
ncbi:hypothetical protein BLS_009926 [Venturia inaequalis]|uniref:C2H2-type domain-containing protein n=1 Tax=Venturia inaequalis TaxID=5025 RepID=A0A8H3VTV4_VENIN|nr:hypothetical protein BLS_009926 [Venturia inaequalis]KAE9994050.1 hypothetical protein EG327_001783 [Venturia inaequalis]